MLLSGLAPTFGPLGAIVVLIAGIGQFTGKTLALEGSTIVHSRENALREPVGP